MESTTAFDRAAFWRSVQAWLGPGGTRTRLRDGHAAAIGSWHGRGFLCEAPSCIHVDV